MFWTVVSQPIIWLAVAALVYGSQVLSLADLWRRGQPAAARVVGASRFDRRGDKRALRPATPPGVARVGSEVREAFLGDIDDKYLPTVPLDPARAAGRRRASSGRSCSSTPR